MLNQLPTPTPPAELPIPKEHQAKIRSLDAAAEHAWAVLEFRKARFVRLVAKGWFECVAIHAHRAALAANAAHRRANNELAAYLAEHIPDTMVGQWDLDSVRMTVTRRGSPGGLTAAFGFGART